MAGRVVESQQVGNYLYELRMIKCGNKRCKSCPHGPYWYLKGVTRHGQKFTRYLGKSRPEEVTAAQPRFDLSTSG